MNVIIFWFPRLFLLFVDHFFLNASFYLIFKNISENNNYYLILILFFFCGDSYIALFLQNYFYIFLSCLAFFSEDLLIYLLNQICI